MTWMNAPNKRWAMGGAFTAMVRPAGDGQALGALWQSIEPDADASVFQSWHWLGCRFEPRFGTALVLSIEAAGAVLAIGLISRRRRFGLVEFAVAETGRADEDSVYIEFNGPLVRRGHTAAHDAWYRALFSHIAGPAGLVRLSGVPDADRAAIGQSGLPYRAETRVAPRQNLAALRDRGTDCLAVVSANTRQQINRAWRGYAVDSAIEVCRASDQPQVLAWLDALAALHSATWQARGRPGAFASAEFRSFHEALVHSGVESGVVDLLRITAGARVIGYLYNFVWRGVVSAYQSGFAYEPDRKQAKPGLICHVAAMRYYQARGLDWYDFLAGDDRYKTSLASNTIALHWLNAVSRGSILRPILAARSRIGMRRTT